MNKMPKKGQSLTEFALILPILLLLIMGIFDLGRAIYYFSAINHAAHEGARYGAINYDNESEIESRVRTSAIGIGDALVFNDIGAYCDSYDRPYIHIDLQYSFEPVTPMIGNYLGADGKVDLQINKDMLIETLLFDDANFCTP
jgi:hypothetical protein